MAGSKVRQKAKKPWDARVLTLMMLAVAPLQACSYPDALNPIEWYRDLTGASKNDESDKSERNSENLAAGNKEPYPNLASVPAAPDRATSSVDREKLRKGLAADRTNAQYSDDELRQGRPVPPLPGEAPVVEAAPAATGVVPAAVSSGGAKHVPPVKGTEPPPRESPLTTPSVRADLPAGDAVRRAPPLPPGLAPPQPPQKPAQLAALPPLPRDSGLARPAAPLSIMRAPGGKNSAVTLEAAEISFTADGGTLGADDNQRLAEVAKLYKKDGGSLRVIGYGRQGYGADAAQQELKSFGEALDRAGAVAQALAKLGVPSGRITVQVAPELVGGGLEAGRAEVLVDY